MKIINNTSLEYATIGMIIDDIMRKNRGNTAYYGKVEWTNLEVGSHKIKVQIRYLKRYVEWRFEELESNKEGESND